MHHHQSQNIPPPYDNMAFALYEQPKPRFVFKMPRVVPDQKTKFDNDELFRRLSRESEVRYTGYRKRAMDERRLRFANDCREGYTEISFVASGTNLQLYFNANHNPYMKEQECDFEKERGKVYLRSSFIMNGVCVRFRGWLQLERLDGVGCLEFDEQRALQEDKQLKQLIDSHTQRIADSKRIFAHTPPEEVMQPNGNVQMRW